MSLFSRKGKESGPCVPVGPNFKKAKRVSTLLSGTKFSLRMNRHMPIVAAESQVMLEPSYNIFTYNGYKKDVDSDLEYFRLLTCSWKFRRAILSSYVGHLELSATIFKRSPCSQDKSLLIPSEFERYVLSDIKRNYGNQFDHGKSVHDVPIDWRVHDHLPVPSVSFEARPATLAGNSRKVHFKFPLDHDILVTFYFGFGQYAQGDIDEKDAAISPEPLYELTRQVIGSVSLEPSESLQSELDKIKKNYPNSKVSPNIKPIKWSTSEQDAEWEEYRRQQAESRKRFQDIKKSMDDPETQALLEKLNNASAEELSRLMDQAIDAEEKDKGES
ncbi:hypothetical protein O5O45_14345 [Hahella aquimaris]|uniref:hypothetical protein n=1 Tax=Hahella sp. HNIBRBA332 TaxID=3015983 RepID=UPI00273AEFC3|nr:hypothetical protein [Hahella sp. HNIBRBA332]WLQ17097.1 hypothetical protein O5O45_14345 [Hahella sp. HNIBRBA332]